MSKKIVIILKDNLIFIKHIIEKITMTAPFRIEYLIFNELLSDEKYRDMIKETGHTNILIMLGATFYKKNKSKIFKFFESLFSVPFSNFILVYKDRQFLKDSDFILGKQNYWYFCKEEDTTIQAISFIIHAVNLFEKSIVSSRLTDYIIDSFKEAVYSEILVKKNQEIERLNKELEKKNKIDYLTNLYNRKALYDFLDLERKRTLRDRWRLDAYLELSHKVEKDDINVQFKNNKPQGTLNEHFGIFSIMMIDIDNFKSVNDKYGHLVGDSVLKTLGELLSNETVLRENDIAGRFGGEEFVVIFPETSSGHAYEPACRLAERFRNIAFMTSEDKDETFNVTLSIGISQYHQDDNTNEEIIHRADKALYYAKRHGKGRVVVFEKVFK